MILTHGCCRLTLSSSISMCTLNGRVPIDTLLLFSKFLGMNCFIDTTSKYGQLLFGRLSSHVSSHYPIPYAFLGWTMLTNSHVKASPCTHPQALSHIFNIFIHDIHYLRAMVFLLIPWWEKSPSPIHFSSCNHMNHGKKMPLAIEL